MGSPSLSSLLKGIRQEGWGYRLEHYGQDTPFMVLYRYVKQDEVEVIIGKPDEELEEIASKALEHVLHTGRGDHDW